MRKFAACVFVIVIVATATISWAMFSDVDPYPPSLPEGVTQGRLSGLFGPKDWTFGVTGGFAAYQTADGWVWVNYQVDGDWKNPYNGDDSRRFDDFTNAVDNSIDNNIRAKFRTDFIADPEGTKRSILVRIGRDMTDVAKRTGMNIRQMQIEVKP